MESGGEHAHDDVGMTVEEDGATENVGVGSEAAFPKLVGEEDNLVAAGLTFLVEEGAAKLRLRAEHGEKTGGNASCGKAFGFTGTSEIQSDVADHGHLFEGADTFAPIKEMHGVNRKTGRKLTEFRNDLVNGDQTILSGVAQRA